CYFRISNMSTAGIGVACSPGQSVLLMPMTTPRRSLLSLSALVVLAGLTAARPGAQQAPRTVGASGAEQISIDFLANAPDGNPILDLTKENLVLKVGGKNRVITGLQLIKIEGPA